jgi:catechol 2,3-dioxygenase-like lactoylglutathione lyase family enzyme
MHPLVNAAENVKKVVPFFMVSDMERSVRYYVDGLGFEIKNRWVVDGKLRWCWLVLGGAALMLQVYHDDGHHPPPPKEKHGVGVSIWFQCADAVALYDEFRARGIEASEPQVGNAMWDTGLIDPDGYKLHFDSPTDVPEETLLSEVRGQAAAGGGGDAGA